MYEMAPGSTSQSVQFYLRDAATVQPKLGLTASSPGATGGYVRRNQTAVAVPLVALASPSAAFTPGGFIEVDPALTPGVYRFDIPNAAIAVGADFVTATLGFDDAIGEGVLILLRNSVSNVGPGGYSYAVTVVDGSADPIGGASLWVSTDEAGTNVVAGALATSAIGVATFLLAAGDYYLWALAQGYESPDPAAFTVAASGGQTVVLELSAVVPTLTNVRTHEARTTAHDVLSRLLDYVGGDPAEQNFRQVRRSFLDALREFSASHKWSYLRAFGRLALSASYGTGTVSYDSTGGTYEKQLTLTDGTWPSWAAKGYVRVGEVVAKVDARVSDTVLTLKDPTFPDDLTDQSFTLYRDTYDLPSDFGSASDAMAEGSWGALTYVPYHHWLTRTRYDSGSGTPTIWTLAASPDTPGRLAMILHPAPDQDGTLDFAYNRRPRPVVRFDVTAGRASVYVSSPTIVEFTDPIITADMVGSVLRLARTYGEPPDGPDGVLPAVYEGNIISTPTTRSVILDTAADTTLQLTSYRISDPVDAEDFQMTLIGRCAEKHLALSRTLKERATAVAAYEDALVVAREADARVASRRSAGPGSTRGRPLRDMPIDFSGE